MTVTAYLLDYTLNVLCQGNRSECARQLCVRRPDFNRLWQRCMEGSSSVRALESMLQFYCREGHSLDTALAGYGGESALQPGRAADLICGDIMKTLRSEMEEERKAADAKSRILRSAESFMNQLESAFCSESCRIYRGCEGDCPCRKFVLFVDWIQHELESNQQNPKENVLSLTSSSDG